MEIKTLKEALSLLAKGHTRFFFLTEEEYRNCLPAINEIKVEQGRIYIVPLS